MSIHQFAHGGDLHLGPNGRNADRRAAFDQFVSDALALPHLAAVLLPGDLNHQRMTIDDRNYLADRLVRMATAAPVVIVRGNHDLPGDLDIFAQLGSKFPITVVADRPGVIWVRTATGVTASIFCLPYPTEAGLVAAGVAPGDLVQTAHEKLTAIILDAAGKLMTARNHGDLTLAIGHINVAGSRTAAGQPNIGQEIELDPTLLTVLGAGYVGLNHIHVGQEIGGAFYPGSMCRLDWSEVDPKRWLCVEAEVNGPVTAWSVIDKPIDVAPMYHVEARLTRADGFRWAIEPPIVRFGPSESFIREEWDPATLAGAEVRLRVHVLASEREIMTDFDVRQPFAMAKRLEVEYIAEPDRALRAPKVAAAKTLAEKVAAWAEVNGAVVTEDVLAKLTLIEHGDPEAVLVDVAKQLGAIVAPEPAREAVTA